jgi:hypothetical protein
MRGSVPIQQALDKSCDMEIHQRTAFDYSCAQLRSFSLAATLRAALERLRVPRRRRKVLD